MSASPDIRATAAALERGLRQVMDLAIREAEAAPYSRYSRALQALAGGVADIIHDDIGSLSAIAQRAEDIEAADAVAHQTWNDARRNLEHA